MNISKVRSPEVVGGNGDTAGLITAVGNTASGIISSIWPPKVEVRGGGTPGWLLPVAIGGIGIIGLAFVASKKR